MCNRLFSQLVAYTLEYYLLVNSSLLHVTGMGELQLEIILDRIRREYKIDAELGAMQVVYKERVNRMQDPVVHSYTFDRVMKGKNCLAQITLSLDGENELLEEEEEEFKLKTHYFWSRTKERPDLAPHILQRLVSIKGGRSLGDAVDPNGNVFFSSKLAFLFKNNLFFGPTSQ